MKATDLPNYRAVNNKEDLRAFQARLTGFTGAVAFDVESTGLEQWKEDFSLTMMQFTFEGGDSWEIPLDLDDSPFQKSWRQVAKWTAQQLKKNNTRLVAHNAAYDLCAIHSVTGVDLVDQLAWDTNVSSHLLKPSDNASTGLKEVAPRELGWEPWNDGFNFDQPGGSKNYPRKQLADYGCLMEGTPVLTLDGWLPIETISYGTVVWDGVEWVRTDGAILQGTADVIKLDNVYLTPDHLVLLSDNTYACAGSIVGRDRRDSIMGSYSIVSGVQPFHREGYQGEGTSESGVPLHTMWGVQNNYCKLPSLWKLWRKLPLSVFRKIQRPSVVHPLSEVHSSSEKMYSRTSNSKESRGQRNQEPVHISRALQEVHVGDISRRDGLLKSLRGPNQQRWSLRAGEYSTSYTSTTSSEHEKSRLCRVHGAACPSVSFVAFSEDGQSRLGVASGDFERPNIERVDGGEGIVAASDVRIRQKVYDILNAGPRNRFAVPGMIVSNCKDTIATLALAERHIRMFYHPDYWRPEYLTTDEEREWLRLGSIADAVAMPAVKAAARLQINGMPVDTARVEEEIKREQQTYDDGLAAMAEYFTPELWTGPKKSPRLVAPTIAPTSKWFLSWMDEAVRRGDAAILSTTKCIARGELVKTDKGDVPIEDITLSHKIWDGIDFYSHSGIESQGERYIITYQGLTATPDHPIYTDQGDTICLGGLAELSKDNRVRENYERRSTVSSKVWLLREVGLGTSERNTQRKSVKLPLSSRRALSQVHRPTLRSVRESLSWSSHSLQTRKLLARREQISVSGRLYYVESERVSEYRLLKANFGSYQQRWSLRKGESSLGQHARTEQQQAKQYPCLVHGTRCPKSPSLASYQVRQPSIRRKSTYRTNALKEWMGRGAYRINSNKREVFDILNAGPRGRFYVSGHLVLNTGAPQFDRHYFGKMEARGYKVSEYVMPPRRASKNLEYLNSIRKSEVNGYVHPSYRAGTLNTGRWSACLAPDSLIEMPRDMVKYPNGVPMSEVKAGDWVYSYDHHMQLVLKQVEWCGPTKIAETVYVDYESSDGTKGTLQCTPDHLIRLYNGSWEHAEYLMRDFGRGDKARPPRLLAMVRRHERGSRTRPNDTYSAIFANSNARVGGHRGGRRNGSCAGGRSLEHRWIMDQILTQTTGKGLSNKFDVNHIDGNKWNNHPSNLEYLSPAYHRSKEVKDRTPLWGAMQAPSPLYEGLTDYRVTAVRKGPVIEVWDMRIPDTHQFIANGITVHNSTPNPQQWAKHIKPNIIAPKGYVLADFDFSQIELRVLSEVADVPSMREAYIRGEDLHRLTASLVAKVPLDQVTKEQRQNAKASNFGLSFNQKPASFREYAENNYGVILTIEEAHETYNDWFRAYPEVHDWHQDVERRLYRDSQITSITGRIRRFPRPWGENVNAAINFGVQSVAGDLMQLVLAQLTSSSDPRNEGITPITTVHDSIVLLLDENTWESHAQYISDVMTKDAPDKLADLIGRPLRVPIGIDYDISTRWGVVDIYTTEDGIGWIK